jgi:hypothetical protein
VASHASRSTGKLLPGVYGNFARYRRLDSVLHSPLMKVTVTRLRERGKRRHDHDIQADQGVTGDLSLATVGSVKELKLADLNDQQLKPVIPVLYEAQLVNLHGNSMLYRGFEKGHDGAGYVQEWRAVVAG